MKAADRFAGRLAQARRLLNPGLDVTMSPAVQWCWDQPYHLGARDIAASLTLDGLPGGRWKRHDWVHTVARPNRRRTP
jgi:hypothetical protein